MYGWGKPRFKIMFIKILLKPLRVGLRILSMETGKIVKKLCHLKNICKQTATCVPFLFYDLNVHAWICKTPLNMFRSVDDVYGVISFLSLEEPGWMEGISNYHVRAEREMWISGAVATVGDNDPRTADLAGQQSAVLVTHIICVSVAVIGKWRVSSEQLLSLHRLQQVSRNSISVKKLDEKTKTVWLSHISIVIQ